MAYTIADIADIKYVNGVIVKLTDAEKQMRADEANAIPPITYDKNRELEYPSIEDQLDMQYWDQVNGTTTWKDAIAKVKADNPKE